MQEDKERWLKAQRWETNWWGNCISTFGEETKQLLYARKMGLMFHHDGKSPYNIDMQGKRVLDIGGGPCSLLLKCVNVKGKAIDPLCPPLWVLGRYASAGIGYQMTAAENINENDWDEVWIYNVLQHVEDPEKVIANAKRAGKLIRIFEWIDTPTNQGHPHSLTEECLNKWLGGEGKVEVLKGENTCSGKCYYGIFPT